MSEDRPPAVILQDIEARAEDEGSTLEYSDILTLVSNNRSREWINDHIVDGEVPDCEHTTDDLQRVEPRGLHLGDDELTVKGECSCGATVHVTAEIANVEVVDHA